MTTLSVVFACSCSSNSPETKQITPTGTEFTSGDVAKLVEVVDEPATLTYVYKDETIASQVFTLKIKLKLVKDSPELKEVDAREINITDLFAGMVIDLVDENDTHLLNLELKDHNALTKLLQGEVGTEAIVTFQTETHNSDDAPKWFKKAAKFSPDLTGNIQIGDRGDKVTTVDGDATGLDDEMLLEPSMPDIDTDALSEGNSEGGENIDEALDAYEKYVDRYIKFTKKVKKDSPSAMTEYAKLLENAQELSDKLDKVKGDFNNEQLQRYSNITMKMVNAMKDMN